MKIKNYSRFQIYKDRQPPWICLHRKLLDDPDWFALQKSDAWLLTMLWLIASEDKSREGILPCTEKIAFRLRMSVEQVEKSLSRLNHWIVRDDTDPYQSVSHRDRERDRDRDRDRDKIMRDGSKNFEVWWDLYPRKVGKRKAQEAWIAALAREDPTKIIEATRRFAEHARTERLEIRFVPHPATWLNRDGWHDELVKTRKRNTDVDDAFNAIGGILDGTDRGTGRRSSNPDDVKLLSKQTGGEQGIHGKLDDVAGRPTVVSRQEILPPGTRDHGDVPVSANGRRR